MSKQSTNANLGDALQGELLHEIDDVRLLEEFLLELLHCHWEGCRVEADLALW